MKQVQTCLCVGNAIQRHFHRRKWAVKDVQASFKCQKRWRKQFSPSWRSCEVGAYLFMCGNHPLTPFSSEEVL